MNESIKDVRLLFYTQKDGIPSMSDSYIISLLDRAEKDGVLSTIFYGDSKYSKNDLLMRVKHEPHHCMFAVAFKGDEIFGFGLIDHLKHHHGFGHFCIFKEFWGNGSVEITREIYRQLLSKFSVLVGVVPEENVYAVNFCRKIGMVEQGKFPMFFYNNDTVKYTDGVIFHISRGGI